MLRAGGWSGVLALIHRVENLRADGGNRAPERGQGHTFRVEGIIEIRVAEIPTGDVRARPAPS